MKKTITLLTGLAIVVSFIGTLAFLYEKSKGTTQEFSTLSPEFGDISNKILITGKIEPRKEINIKPRISGIIDSIKVVAGKTVKKGDIIATIRVIPEMLELSSAKSRVELAEINCKNSLDTLKRNKKLYKSASISEAKMEELEYAANLTKQELAAAKENLLLVREGRTGKADNLSNTLIRSTTEGTILDIPVKEGDSVIHCNSMNEGTTIAVIADMNDMIFRGEVDEVEIEKIETGVQVGVILTSNNDLNMKARTEFISPKGVDNNGAVKFEIKAAISMKENIHLRSGYSAAGEIVLAERKNVLLIDEGVIDFTDKGSFVDLLINPEKPAYKKIEIKTGLSDGINIEVISGLSQNDKVRVDESLLKKVIDGSKNQFENI